MRCLIKENASVEIAASEKIKAVDGYCLFEVKACGICGSDIPRVFSGTSYFYPIVLDPEALITHRIPVEKLIPHSRS
jgi:threonine dehydrogenase-like Zn-dependent dehydrogenase